MVRRLRSPHRRHDRASTSMLLGFLLAALACPQLAGAQGGPITVMVQVLTVQREPVPNVAVQVVDAATNQPLAAGTTDQRGQARFATMPPTEIRVRITGQLSDGTLLRHTRQDQRGIWVNLPHQDWMMDLRVDTDGLVFPDLGLGNAGAPDAGAATAIAEGVLPTVYPTAPPATAVPRTTPQQVEVVQAPAPAQQTDVSQAAPSATSPRPGVVLLVLLLGTIAGVAWLMTRGRM